MELHAVDALLVVDADGTLPKTVLLIASIVALLLRKPLCGLGATEPHGWLPRIRGQRCHRPRTEA